MLRANASSSSSSLKKVSPSSSSFKNNKGENIIVVGLGTRGVTIIDELQEGVLTESTILVDIVGCWDINEDKIDEQMAITAGDERYSAIGGD